MARRSENWDYRRGGAARVRPGFARLLAGAFEVSLTNEATDDFNALGSGASLSSDADWSALGLANDDLIEGDGSGQILLDSSTAGDLGACVYTGTVYGVSHAAEIDIALTGGNPGIQAVIVRATTTGAYVLQATSGLNLVLYRATFDPWSLIIIGSAAAPVVDGDTVRLEAIGSTIRALLNGDVKVSVSDNTYTSGKPGVLFRNSLNFASTGRLDNFKAYDAASINEVASITEQPTRIFAFERDDDDVELVVAGAVTVASFAAGGPEWTQ